MAIFEKIYIEISNICNLQCTFCPVVERDKKIMDVALFEKIAREIRPFTKQITLHVMGEPLAHPQFEDILKQTTALGLSVVLTSNGLLLRRYKELLLKTPNLAQINFSTHSFTDNFPNKDMTPYLEELIQFTKEMRLAHHQAFVNFRLWNLRKDEATFKKNQRVLNLLNDHFNQELTQAINPEEQKSYRLTHKTFIHFDSQFRWPTLEDPTRATTGTCHGTLSHLAIHADGTVVPCCLDKEANIPLSNLRSTTFEEVLKETRLIEMQQGFRSAQLKEELCQKCTFIERFDNKAKRILAAKEKQKVNHQARHSD